MTSTVVSTGTLGSTFTAAADLVSQDFASNSSIVRVRGLIYNNSSTTSYNNNAISHTISGSASWSAASGISVPGKTTATIIDQSFTIYHDAAGNATPSFTVGFGATGTAGLGGPTSATVSIGLPRLAAPPNPPGCSATGITSSSAVINVRSGGDNRDTADWYGAWVATDPGFSNIVSSHTGGTYTATGLARATKYYARAQAHSPLGYSGYSGTVTFTTAATVPDTPGVPSASGITSSGCTESWTAPNNGGSAIDQYELQIATDNGFTSLVYDGYPTSTSAVLSGLSRATTYYARVRAHNGIGWGAWTAAGSFTTSATVPDTPATPTTDTVLQTSANVNWVAPNNGGSALTGYTLQVATDAAFSNVVATYTPVSGATSQAVSGLNSGLTYYARIRANNSVGNGSYSPAVSFATLPGVYVNVEGGDTGWHESIPFANIANVWKQLSNQEKVGTVWKS